MPTVDTFGSAMRFAEAQRSLAEPAFTTAAVVPSDTVPLAYLTRAVYVGTAGSLTVVDAGGNTTTFSSVPGGTMLPLRIQQIKATGTSAGSIVALW
jgi:hypothetical protein